MSLTDAEIREAFAEPRPRTAPDRPVPGPGLFRPVELAIASVGLLCSLPLMICAAVAIRIEGRGPVLYRQRRVGLDEREFRLIKLRTMREGSDPVGVGTAVGDADPRVTKTGAVLRRLSIDELPNLWNVIRGEMALVGPRPTIPAHLEHMSERQRLRHRVRPGMTGLAQISGRIEITWGERIELDLDYIARRSPALDLQILLRTLAGPLG